MANQVIELGGNVLDITREKIATSEKGFDHYEFPSSHLTIAGMPD